MKKIISILFIVGLVLLNSCSKEALTTDPTDKVSGTAIFGDAQNAMTAVDGIYRAMYSSGWGTDWTHENGGLPAFNLVFDLMGEDHLMDGSGSGWFWYDYAFDTWGDWTHTAGHQYQIWNFFYTIISNANYILAQEETLTGLESMKNYVLGQAYALRSFAYMWLAQVYTQSWDVTKPGVPIYTEPTVAGSEGNPRGTVQDVFNIVNSDIDKAIAYLEGTSQVQKHRSHIDKYVAYGLKARYSLVQRDYPAAEQFAIKALSSPRVIASSFSDIKNVNDASKNNVMWGLVVQSDQAMGNAGIYAHMDADSKGTYSKARHLVDAWLYERIPDTDIRKGWWTAPLDASLWGEAGSAQGSKRSWCQTKLVYIDAAAGTGDFVLMRKEEMALIAAEASCRQDKYTQAREYVSMVGSKRDSKYATRLANFTDSKVYNSDTHANLVTLMDEILFQRRVELWGELPRLHDLIRLDLGFNRDYSGSNHTKKIPTINTKPKSPAFIIWIPRKEFDGNKSLDPTKDQNPLQG